MTIDRTKKQEVIGSYAVHEGDTGSPEVQVALLTERIQNLSTHLETNKKDRHSRRGLLGLVERRRRLLKYLATKDGERYNTLTSRLKLRK